MADDPYAPVEGVTLEQFTEAAVAMHRETTPEAMEAAAQRHGIPPGRATPIGEEWTRRMQAHPEMVYRYHELYQQAMKKAGITAPEITLEQYAEILRRQGTGEAQEQILASFDLTLQQFAMVSQGWGEKIMRNPSLAMRLASLMGVPGVTGTPPQQPAAPDVPPML